MQRTSLIICGTLAFSVVLAFESPLYAQGGIDPQKIFDALDRNRNGVIEKREMGRRSNLLLKFDFDGDGQVSREEVQGVRQQVDELVRTARRRPAGSEPIEIVDEIGPEMPFTIESCRRAAEHSIESNGKSVLVMYEGKVVYEHYHSEGSPDTAWELASGTKSFSGVIAMLLVQDGLLELDEKVSDTITEWKSDPRKSQITVNQLLHLTSGLKPNLDGPLISPTWEEAITAPAIHEPGTKFEYGPVAFQCFGELVKRKLADRSQGPLEYLTERVFEPIGLEPRNWRMDQNGDPQLPAGAWLTAREWAKFGEFVRLGGSWDGKQILKTELLDQCFDGTRQNPAYGLTFWLGKERGLGGGAGIASKLNQSEDLSFSPGSGMPRDIVMANGLGGQRLFISRDAKLVVVRQSDAGAVVFRQVDGSGWSDKKFLQLLLSH
jgi:CubicO group peptidase (beta-lactamase class C family)